MAHSHSYGSLGFTKEDEEREINELSQDEINTIRNDMYGIRRRSRNGGGGRHEISDDGNNKNNAADVDDDANVLHHGVSEELLQEFYTALDNIEPFEKTEKFWEAWIQHEELVNEECDFSLFIKCENYDVNAAALRICEYWNMRVEVFGPIHAFERLSLRHNDAFKDVIPFMVEMPNLCRTLPHDDSGRLVICWDSTGRPTFKNHDIKIDLKIGMFVTHQILKNMDHDAGDDVVLIMINKSSVWDLVAPRKLAKLSAKTIFKCLPLRFVCQHRVVSSTVSTVALSLWKYYLSRHDRLRLKVHTYSLHNQITILNDLAEYGLQPHNLPTSIDGSYDEKPIWIDECEHIIRERRKKRRLLDDTTAKAHTF